jgi:hypothetical protein
MKVLALQVDRLRLKIGTKLLRLSKAVTGKNNLRFLLLEAAEEFEPNDIY